MTCSARGQSYVVIAERRAGNVLRFVGHEMPQAGGGAGRMPGRLEGQYSIEMNGWRCPLCQNGDAVWLCDCTAMNGAMPLSRHIRRPLSLRLRQSRGTRIHHRSESRGAGTSVAATPQQARSGIQPGQPQLKQVTYDR